MSIFLVGASVAVTLLIVYLWLRGNSFKDRWWGQYQDNSELFERAIEAEKESTRLAEQLNFIKTQVTAYATRNVVAVLTDQQAQHLIEAVSQIAMSAATPPDRLN